MSALPHQLPSENNQSPEQAEKNLRKLTALGRRDSFTCFSLLALVQLSVMQVSLISFATFALLIVLFVFAFQFRLG
jgi:hypothetical protein